MPDLETSSTVCETDSNTDSDDSESDDDNTKLYCFCQKRNYTHFHKYRLITQCPINSQSDILVDSSALMQECFSVPIFKCSTIGLLLAYDNRPMVECSSRQKCTKGQWFHNSCVGKCNPRIKYHYHYNTVHRPNTGVITYIDPCP